MVWLFVFSKNRRFSGHLKKHSESKELAGLGCLKHSSIKEPSVLGISKNPRRTISVCERIFLEFFFLNKEIGKILEFFISLVKSLTIFFLFSFFG